MQLLPDSNILPIDINTLFRQISHRRNAQETPIARVLRRQFENSRYIDDVLDRPTSSAQFWAVTASRSRHSWNMPYRPVGARAYWYNRTSLEDYDEDRDYDPEDLEPDEENSEDW
ncbi:MAG: hypothetical protein DRR06_15820 [Gammaproteobacteria bacterium]|nr:MAG: hypothetical protein DRR06_15820 [Gammaproteobacteria bacterium]